jgi:hypothetical protein
VIFDDHQFGTEMPSGGHPPHQLAASFISGSYTGLYRGMLEGIADRFVRGILMRQPTTGEMRNGPQFAGRSFTAIRLQNLKLNGPNQRVSWTGE